MGWEIACDEALYVPECSRRSVRMQSIFDKHTSSPVFEKSVRSKRERLSARGGEFRSGTGVEISGMFLSA